MRNAYPIPDTDSLSEWLQDYFIVAVVPAYRVEKEIESVVRSMPAFVSRIIVVDDASPDRTGAVVEKLAALDDRIVLVQHEANQGVGGAMITGFRKALDIGAQVVVKVDGESAERRITPRATASAISKP